MGSGTNSDASPDRHPDERLTEARRAYRELHVRCFWPYDPDYEIQHADIPWVAERLMRYGGREGWERGAKLCR